jgi:sugar phosphate isomerase/epimerase
MEKLRMPHDNRTFPGEGTIDFAPVFEQLNRLHYDGAISLEIWNREFHQANPAEVVKKACESLQRIEARLNKLT